MGINAVIFANIIYDTFSHIFYSFLPYLQVATVTDYILHILIVLVQLSPALNAFILQEFST